VRATGLIPAGATATQLAFGEEPASWRDAEQAVDKIAGRFGPGTVRPAVLVRDTERGGPLRGWGRAGSCRQPGGTGGPRPAGHTGPSCSNPAPARAAWPVREPNPRFASGYSFPCLAALVLWRDTHAMRPRSSHLSPGERFMGGAVPLSEHEQRQLEQIEQALYTDYPKLAQSVRSQDPRVHYKRRVVEAAIGFVIGVGLLLAGVISKIIFVGVGGFLVMLAC